MYVAYEKKVLYIQWHIETMSKGRRRKAERETYRDERGGQKKSEEEQDDERSRAVLQRPYRREGTGIVTGIGGGGKVAFGNVGVSRLFFISCGEGHKAVN